MSSIYTQAIRVLVRLGKGIELTGKFFSILRDLSELASKFGTDNLSVLFSFYEILDDEETKRKLRG
jgi:hypothetical protein